MNVLDLGKATLVCGGFAFLIYSYPLLGQVCVIGFLALLWSVYAYKTVARLWRARA
jgi:hypothetical protein